MLLSALAFALLIVSAYLREPLLALRIGVAAAVPFFVVTVLRKLVDAPRPYELYSFYETAPKRKSGSSFPSRHVFSSFVIATLSFILSPWLTAAIAIVGVALSVSRVLLGIHFVRDVLAGALIGITSGLIGLVLIVF